MLMLMLLLLLAPALERLAGASQNLRERGGGLGGELGPELSDQLEVLLPLLREAADLQLQACLSGRVLLAQGLQPRLEGLDVRLPPRPLLELGGRFGRGLGLLPGLLEGSFWGFRLLILLMFCGLQPVALLS
jgi:hypothetical protein